MDLDKYRAPHFVGVGGMGMRALASVLLEKGFSVSGSDVNDSDFLQEFRNRGAHICIGHKAENIDGADSLVVSTAISGENVEVKAARDARIPIFHRSDVLAAIFRWGKGIAVAGAHGKSTTSGMLGEIFYDTKKDPTVILGAEADYMHGNSRLGHGEYVIAEADESDGSFLKFSTSIAIVTNIEDDHLDHYGTVENIRKAFVEFIGHISDPEGLAVLCTDSEGVRAILPFVKKKYVTYGLNEGSEYRAVNKRYDTEHRMLFDVLHDDQLLGTLVLQIPGEHNVRDALGAAVAALHCGIAFSDIAKALSNFNGVKRRFQTKSKIDNVWIVDDYAHHPTEIEATLRAAKETGRPRIICAFQPHRYSRTNLLKDEFAEAFDDADVLFFTDIYSAGEAPIPGVDGMTIPQLVRERHPEKEIRYVKAYQELPEVLRLYCKPGDMVITMGAGTITKVGDWLSTLIKEKGLVK